MELLPMIVAGLAIIALLSTLITFLFNFLVKVKPKPKSNIEDQNENQSSTPKSKKSLLLKYPLMFLYVSFLIFTFLVYGTKNETNKMESMDYIIANTSLILANARTQLFKAPIADFESVMKKVQPQYKSKILDKLDHAIENLVIYKRWSRDVSLKSMNKTIEKMNELLSLGSYKNYGWMLCRDSNFTDEYEDKEYFDVKKLKDRVGILYEYNKNLIELVPIRLVNFPGMVEKLKNQTKNQLKADIGINATKRIWMSRINMIHNFQAVVDHSETTRRDWIENVKDLEPMFSTPIIVKIIVTVTCAVIYFISHISIYCSENYSSLDSKIYAKCVLLSCYIHGLLNIVTIVVKILLAFGIIGKFDCLSVMGNFGLSNFISSVNSRSSSLPICATPNSTFFSVLGNGTVSYAIIVESLGFAELDRTIQNIVRESNLFIKLPPDYYHVLTAFKRGYDELMKLDIGCLDEMKHDVVISYKDWLKIYFDEVDEFIRIVETINVGSEEFVVGSLFEKFHAEQRKAIEASLAHVNGNISASDFSCHLIIDLYANVGNSICKLFDIPINNYWIYLIVTAVISFVYFLLQIIVYRRLVNVCYDNVQCQEVAETTKMVTCAQSTQTNIAPNSGNSKM